MPIARRAVTPVAKLEKQGNLALFKVNRAAFDQPLRIVYGPAQVGADLLALNYNKFTGVITAAFAVCEGGTHGIQAIDNVRVNGEAPPPGFTIIKHLGAPGQLPDARLAAAIAGYADALEGVAYVVLQWPAGAIDTWPILTCDIRGLKVFNPKNGLTEYSENPALQVGDFISSPVYGRGTPVDLTSLEAAQNACNDPVYGANRRRSYFIIDSPQEVDEWVDIMRAYAGCFVDYRNEKAYLIPDRPAASVMALTTADLVKGSLKIRKADSANLPTVIRVIYSKIDEGGDWIDHPSDPAELPGVSTGAVPRRNSDVPMPGIFRHAQAYREAVERLNKLHLADLSIDFTMFDRGLRLVLGDVFTLSHPLGFSNKTFRVIAPPIQGSIGRWSVSAVEYSDAAYSDVVVNEPGTPDTSLPVNVPPAPVTGVAVSETAYQLRSGEYAARLDVSWEKSVSLYVTGYTVTVLDGVTPIWSMFVTNSPVSTSPLRELVNYTVEVRAVSALYVGEAGTASHYLIGKYAKPAPPASITAFEAGGEVWLAWERSADIDAKRYHLRYSTPGQSWAEGQDLDIVDALRLVTRRIPQGTFRIWVKTIDSVLQESDTAAFVDVVVTRDDNAFAAGNLDPMPAGATVNMHVTEEVRGSGVSQYYSESGQSLTAVFGSADISTFNAPMLSYQTMPAPAEWNSAELDLLVDHSAGWLGNVNFQDISGAAVATLGLKASGAPSFTYGPLSQSATARYGKMRLTSTGAVLVRAPAGFLRADVRAAEEVGTVNTATTGRTTVTLSKRYAAVRSIVLTPQGTSSVSATVDNVQLNVAGYTEFDVYLFNTATGARVAAPVGWQFKGV